MRFSKGVRLCGCIAYIIQMVRDINGPDTTNISSAIWLLINILIQYYTIHKHVHVQYYSDTYLINNSNGLPIKVICIQSVKHLSFVFKFQTMYMAIVLYAPSLALSAG